MSPLGIAEGNGNEALINAAFYGIGAIIFLIVGYGIWHIWDSATSPTLKLKKIEWKCTDIRTKHIMIVTRRGGIDSSVTTVCDQYSKIGVQAAGATVK